MSKLKLYAKDDVHAPVDLAELPQGTVKAVCDALRRAGQREMTRHRPIKSLSVSQRAINTCLRNGVATMGDLEDWSQRTLPGGGHRVFRELQAEMESAGLGWPAGLRV